MLETLIENPPPVIDVAELPENVKEYCDKWGNIKMPPEKSIEQHIAGDFVKVNIYKIEQGYFYGFQMKIRKLIYQKKANVIKDTPQENFDMAKITARREIADIVNRYSKKLIPFYLSFDKVCYNQPELF